MITPASPSSEVERQQVQEAHPFFGWMPALGALAFAGGIAIAYGTQSLWLTHIEKQIEAEQ